MTNTINKLTKLSFYAFVFFFHLHEPINALSKDYKSSSLSIAKQALKNIKKDEANNSYAIMINDLIMKEHTLNNHRTDQPYFYTDRREIITEIVSMVLENSGGVINEIAKTGIIKIYRTFNFDKDIAPLLVKEKKSPQNYKSSYLGETRQGPTNQVIVLLKVENYKDLKDIGKNLRFITAYPVKIK